MTREAPAPDAPDVLDQLHRKLDLLLGDDAPGQPRPPGFRSAIASAKLFVLDERAPQFRFHTNSTTPKKEDPDVKRTLLALRQNSGATGKRARRHRVRSERDDAGYRAGISEALVQVMETRKSL